MNFASAFLLIFTTLLLSSAPAFCQTLVLNTDNTYPRSSPEGTGFQDLIVKEAFRRIGRSVEIVHLPSERALVNVDKGIDDGNFVRIPGLEKKYPNLIMVPEKICDFQFAVFGKDRTFTVNGWDSLKPYHVGIISGWKILEANISGTRSLTRVKDAEALFALLAHDRADLVVFDRLQGNALIEKQRLAGVKALKPLLAQPDMYLYLNRRHEDLVPKLAAALQSIKKDGTFQRIMSAVACSRE